MSVVARFVALVLSAGVAGGLSGNAVAFNDTTVAAQTGGFAAGRDMTGNTFNFGPTPEQVRELTEAAVRGATGPLATMMRGLSRQLDVTEDATRTLLRIVGEEDVPLERLSETLNRVAGDYKRLQAQAGVLNPDNPVARGLVERAKTAITAGRLPEARQLLAQARQAQVAAGQEARRLRVQAQVAEDAQLLGAAESAATEGGVAMTERQYDQAAELFRQAAELVPAGHADVVTRYVERQAGALYRQGEERGDNAALVDLISIRRKLVLEQKRELAPLDWAEAQMNLGTALWTLGGRESGTARLEQAVQAYRAALEEEARERVPLDWALTQMNLGVVLLILGQRESGTARLEQAVDACHAALQEFIRERVPLDWALTMGYHGIAIRVIAERDSDATKAQLAVQQIELAFGVLRDGGHAHDAAIFEAQLPQARSLLDRLASRGQ